MPERVGTTDTGWAASIELEDKSQPSQAHPPTAAQWAAPQTKPRGASPASGASHRRVSVSRPTLRLGFALPTPDPAGCVVELDEAGLLEYSLDGAVVFELGEREFPVR